MKRVLGQTGYRLDEKMKESIKQIDDLISEGSLSRVDDVGILIPKKAEQTLALIAAHIEDNADLANVGKLRQELE